VIWVDCDASGTPLTTPIFFHIRALSTRELERRTEIFELESRRLQHETFRPTISERVYETAVTELERRRRL
jgi:hypothetical protein